MGVFTMVVVIVIVSCVAGVANRLIKMKYLQAENHAPDEATTSQINDLEARIQVWEKLLLMINMYWSRRLTAYNAVSVR